MASFGQVLKGGAAYDITGGQVLQGGAVYDIIEGQTKIDGTNYTIGKERTTHTVRIAGGYNNTVTTYAQGYVTYNGTKYTSGTLTMADGDTITISTKSGRISIANTATYQIQYTYKYVDDSGSEVTETSTLSGSTLKTTTKTITSDVTITFTAKSTSGGGTISPI